MGEFVDDDVVSILVVQGAVPDVVPGEDDRSGPPRFTQADVMILVMIGAAVERLARLARLVGIRVEQHALQRIEAAVAVVEE